MSIRAGVAAAGIALALASAAWIEPAERQTYAVFFAFAVAFTFVWMNVSSAAVVARTP